MSGLPDRIDLVGSVGSTAFRKFFALCKRPSTRVSSARSTLSAAQAAVRGGRFRYSIRPGAPNVACGLAET